MDDNERGYGDVDGAMCRSHIIDTALAEKLSAAVPEGDDVCVLCAISGGSEPSDLVPLREVQRLIMDVFTSLYEPALAAGVPWEGGWQGAEISDPLEILYQVCEKAIEDRVYDSLVDVLHEAVLEQDWTENRHPSSLEAAYLAWDQFVEDVRTQSRFIFPPSDPDLKGVAAPGQRSASFLQSLLPYAENESLGLVSTVPSGTSFYRGRLVSDDRSRLTTAAELGPAPAKLAAANRMSPEGIPMFYGSATPETAVEEIASHGTKNYARIGGFKSQQDLRVLDLTKNLEMPSLFAPDTLNQYGALQFFRRFAANVTAPMGPNDHPSLTYVPTQVITEFFRWVPKTPLDGIKLRSAQNGEDTYVLFFDAERVEDAPGLDDATSSAPSDSTGWFSIAPLPPVLTLDPDDVKTYKITRSVTATEVDLGSGAIRTPAVLKTP
jgi:hypothetical protein